MMALMGIVVKLFFGIFEYSNKALICSVWIGSVDFAGMWIGKILLGLRALVVRRRVAAESIPPEIATTALVLLAFLNVSFINFETFSVSFLGVILGG